MKVQLIASNELRFESENEAESKFLDNLGIALHEPRDAHFETFRKVYPYRDGFWGRLFGPRNRPQLWERWISIRPRVDTARFHDGSLILTISENTAASAQTER